MVVTATVEQPEPVENRPASAAKSGVGRPLKLGVGKAQKRGGQLEEKSLPTPIAHPQRKRRQRKGWIEFKKKNGKRYARRRSWKKVDGEWKKAYHGRVRSIPVMTEKEYNNYVKQREAAKRRRKRKGNR